MEEKFQAAGDVSIKKISLITNQGKIEDLTAYFIELNLYESIFHPSMSGSITLGDARNLVKELPILGEEILYIDINTPTAKSTLRKVFRIYSLTNKTYVQDGASQIYILNFCSVEVFRDISNPIFSSFSGKPSDIVRKIYDTYLKVPREIEIDKSQKISQKSTDLIFLTNTANTLKFVSPGWSPIRCINWIASKSEPRSGDSSNFLFWETSKAFYFGSVGSILKNSARASIGKYFYSAALASRNLDQQKKLYIIQDISVGKVFDQIDNKLNGYLSSRVVDVNLYNKSFQNYDYDHPSNFLNYGHSEGNNSLPLFDFGTSRNPLVYRKLNYSNPKLNSISNNFTERSKFIFGNRLSTMRELGNFSMTVVIPGRTDVEAGSLIDITLPKGFPVAPEEKSQDMKDDLYSGYYFITSLNHKINKFNHYITMEVSKDCLPAKIKYD